MNPSSRVTTSSGVLWRRAEEYRAHDGHQVGAGASGSKGMGLSSIVMIRVATHRHSGVSDSRVPSSSESGSRGSATRSSRSCSKATGRSARYSARAVAA